MRFVTSVRGIGRAPTTAPSSSDGCMGFMNAGFGARLARFAPPRFALRRAPALRAPAFFLPPFFAPPRLAAPFRPPFLVAMLSLLVRNGAGFTLKPRVRRARKYKTQERTQVVSPRELQDFPSGESGFSEGRGVRANAFSGNSAAADDADDAGARCASARRSLLAVARFRTNAVPDATPYLPPNFPTTQSANVPRISGFTAFDGSSA